MLASEEDLARHLMASLGAAQEARADIDTVAPADIITTPEPRVEIDVPSGLCATSMTEDQRRLLIDLVVEYTSRMPDDVANT